MDIRPDLLSMPNVPKPLHGLNPRTIMGNHAWNIERKKVYQSTDYHCAACGVHASNADFYQRVEAHEIYKIDYANGKATLLDIVPLCHSCHMFIHSGLLRIKAQKKEVSANHVRKIMAHGAKVLVKGQGRVFLGTAQLMDLVGVSRGGLTVIAPPKNVAEWSRWRLIWRGEEYKTEFTSMRDWQKRYN